MKGQLNKISAMHSSQIAELLIKTFCLKNCLGGQR